MSKPAKKNNPMLNLLHSEIKSASENLLKLIESFSNNPENNSTLQEILVIIKSLKSSALAIGLDNLGNYLKFIESCALSSKIDVNEKIKVLTSFTEILSKAAQIQSNDLPDWDNKNKDTLIKENESTNNESTVETKTVTKPAQPKPLKTNISTYILFEDELKTHTDSLESNILELEKDSSDIARFETLMRAAHSIKGASQLVGLSSLVDLSHAIESFFTNAKSTLTPIGSDYIDILLSSIDVYRTFLETDQTAWDDLNTKTLRDINKIVESFSKPLSSSTSKESIKQPVMSFDFQRNRHNKRITTIQIEAKQLERIVNEATQNWINSFTLKKIRNKLQEYKENQLSLAPIIKNVEDVLIKENNIEAALFYTNKLKEKALYQDNFYRDYSEMVKEFYYQNSLTASNLYKESLQGRLVPIREALVNAKRIVRDLSKELNKKIQIEIEGDDTLIDRDVLKKIDSPIIHLIRNACDHGIEMPEDRIKANKKEEGTIHVRAYHQAGLFQLEISDDGKGINDDDLKSKIMRTKNIAKKTLDQLSHMSLYEYLFEPEITTKDNVTNISGRGVGLDIVKNFIDELEGSIEIESILGRGTTFNIAFPITQSITPCIEFSVHNDLFAIPLKKIHKLYSIPSDQVKTYDNNSYIEYDDNNVPIFKLSKILSLDTDNPKPKPTLCFIIIDSGQKLYALEVDCIVKESRLIIKPLNKNIGKVPFINATSINEDNKLVLILDLISIVFFIKRHFSEDSLSVSDFIRNNENIKIKSDNPTILFVDDSEMVRSNISGILTAHGYNVETAVDGLDGWNKIRLHEYDLVISDIDMPKMNGYEFLTAAKSNPYYNSIPFIIISSKSETENKPIALELGAIDYLSKSVYESDIFIETIKSTLNQND